MSLIEARRRNASAFRLRFSQSLARRLHRPSRANVRSTTQRFGRTTSVDYSVEPWEIACGEWRANWYGVKPLANRKSARKASAQSTV